MNKIIYIVVIVLAIVSCKQKSTEDYVILSGKISNQIQNNIIIYNNITRIFDTISP